MRSYLAGSGWRLRVGLAAGLLATVVAAALVFSGGDEDDLDPSLASPNASLDSESAGGEGSAPGRARSPGESGPGGRSGSGGGGGVGGGGASDPEDPSSSSDIPEGRPVGRVPPGAGPDADRDAIGRTLRSFLVSISRGNGFQACAQLTAEGRSGFARKIAEIAPETEGAPCEATIVLYQGAYGKAIRDPKITNLRVSGNSARATGPLDQPASLIKDGRLWQIDRYGDDY